ncbi:sugar transporter [Primorskyibacter flagellatus]|uniref:sugar transporter n=1 Tax=Primorskyibacter flagellatus TaxID=1387277 RepID=UPI003A95C7EE
MPQAVTAADVKPRHFGLLAAFLVIVVAPLIVAAYYLFVIAEDQYTSTVGFSVRSEELNSSLDLLSGLNSLSGTSSSDTDILYEFIQSQDLVKRLDERLDLRAIYSKPDFDPIFAYDEAGSIEDLVAYWRRMVRIFYDSGTGLIELRVHAFEPQDAQDIATEIFQESSAMINQLSAIARDDATGYAEEELVKAEERLKVARQALTRFRSETQIVDPSADIQGQMGLLNSLEAQLAEAIIEMNLLRETTRAADPRIEQSERRIAVIEQLIEKERTKFGVGTGNATGGQDYSTLVGEYERLVVDREFAEKAYVSALSAFDGAQAEARRQSRYLAAYTRPTLAESSGYPQRWLLTLLTGVFAFLTWAIVVLIYYSVRDRR